MTQKPDTRLWWWGSNVQALPISFKTYANSFCLVCQSDNVEGIWKNYERIWGYHPFEAQHRQCLALWAMTAGPV